jgi:hypothetical protein
MDSSAALRVERRRRLPRSALNAQLRGNILSLRAPARSGALEASDGFDVSGEWQEIEGGERTEAKLAV